MPEKDEIYTNGGREMKVGAPERRDNRDGFALLDPETGANIGWAASESFTNGWCWPRGQGPPAP